MDLIEFYPVLKSLWVVWFFLLFGGIVVWAMWPARRDRLQEHGSIPLRDTENR
jgi:cytochrome c oxidase cbb3-type subunit IV